jgi:putative oxidoreductase
MKIAVIIVRVLMGLIFTASAIVVLFHIVKAPPLEGNVKLFNEGIAATGYFMQTLKGIELVCGLALIIGRYVALTTVVIFPITVNIFLYHAFLMPEGLPVAIFLLLGNLFLAYVNREKYKPLFIA